MLSYTGYYDLRLGKTILFILISYIMLAKLAVEGSRYIVNRNNKVRLPKLTAGKGLVILVALALSVQLFADKKKTVVLLAKDAALYFSNADKNKLYGSGFNNLNEQIGTWIKLNLSDKDRVLTTWVVDGKAIYFYGGAKIPVYNLPLSSSDDLLYARSHASADGCIFVDHFGTGIRPVDRIYFIDDHQLLGYLREEKIDYIILTERRFFLKPYFEEALGLIEVARFKDNDAEAAIFKVDNNNLVGLGDNRRVYIVKGVYRVLGNWKKMYPEKYNVANKFLSSLSKNRVEVDYGYPEDDS